MNTFEDDEYCRAEYAWLPKPEVCARDETVEPHEGYHELRYALQLNKRTDPDDWEYVPTGNRDCLIIDKGDNLLTLQAWDTLVRYVG